MKKILITAGIIIMIVAGYAVLPISNNKNIRSSDDQLETYSRADIGLEFDYRTGPSGYVLDERIPADLGEELIRFIILHQAKDTQSETPVGSEGAPVISIAVLANPAKQFPGVWAEAHLPYSNINLKSGPVEETVVGGANAIRYVADGLYASENVIVAHGGNIYVITGQFLDQNSNLRSDFTPLVESIRFIPQPGQE
jgi:hypothetical protein